VILSDLVPLKRRGTFQGYMNIVFASGTSLGAPIGGLVADWLGWRWSFGIQIPLILVSILIVLFRFNLPEREISIESVREKLRRVDFWGAVTLVCLLPSLDANVDFLCECVDIGIESRRERVTMDTSTNTHYPPSVGNILRNIPSC
jgi:MFS family permease